MVEVAIVERSETRRDASERAHQSELRGQDIDDAAESDISSEGDPVLGFPLDVREWIAAGQHDRDHGIAAVSGEREVTARHCRVEGLTDERPAGAKVLTPGIDVGAELLEYARLETVQAASVHEIQRQPAETESRAVVAEMRAEHQGVVHVGKAGGVAVAMLQAEIRHAAGDEALQMRIGRHCGRLISVSTSMAASWSGSRISGRSMSASMGRVPSCCQTRAHSRCRASAVGCAGKSMPAFRK